jgi:hypothetical protein
MEQKPRLFVEHLSGLGMEDVKASGHSQAWWLTPVILATWEAEIRKMTIQGHDTRVWC